MEGESEHCQWLRASGVEVGAKRFLGATDNALHLMEWQEMHLGPPSLQCLCLQLLCRWRAPCSRAESHAEGTGDR